MPPKATALGLCASRFQRVGRVTRIPSSRATWAQVTPGWLARVHVAIDDHSRVAFSSVHTDEKGSTACQALLAALAYYKTPGVTFHRVLTYNGACYRSGTFARLSASLGMKHHRTKPYTPRTNGKAERFIQTSLHEWDYACEYAFSEQHNAVLPEWLRHYN